MKAERALRTLARDNGVQLSYRDIRGELRRASSDALVAVLRALGSPIASAADAPALLAARDTDAQRLEPVTVAWDGKPPPLDHGDDACNRILRLEDGTERAYATGAGERLDLGPLPLGYHDLLGPRDERTRIISAPRRAPVLGRRTSRGKRREWGVFLPLHALHSQRSMGVGDLTDLEGLLRWTNKLGGRFVGTLPLYATFLDQERFDPSPYAPVSRLFYNELYADPERTPEFERNREARELMSSSVFRADIDVLRRATYVDHARVYALKRRVLELLADAADGDDARMRAFTTANPLAEDYARFRAGLETGTEKAARADAERYHLYAQLVMHEQLAAVAGAEAEGGLYLDLPLGVHHRGFDVQVFADEFVSGVTVGAPPDDFFAGGQNWGAPPLHPKRSRASGHAYFSAVVAKAMRAASVLRIDHVMGLHRQYWIPTGMPADEGVYVTYPAEELYAIVALEASRHQTTVVGEDLGTVPRGVRTTMRRHGLLSTYVAQFETAADPQAALRPPDGKVLACVNTHDMGPFAAFWAKLDGTQRLALLSFLEPDDTDAAGVLRALLRYLASSDAPVVLVNLEDLLGEQEPQNVPGTTTDEQPNWSRRAKNSFEEFATQRNVLDALADVGLLRNRSEGT